MKTHRLRSLAVGLATLPAVGMYAQTQALADGMGTLFRIADANNTSVSACRTAIEKAELNIQAAKAQRLPDVKTSLAFSYLGNAQLWNRHLGDFHNAPMPHWGNNFSLTAQQVLYSGGAVTSGIRLAELEKEMETHNDEGNRRGVHLLVASLYLQLHSLDNHLQVIDSNIALADTLISRTRDRYEEGVVLRNDITRYELMREQMQLQATVISGRKDVVRKQLQTAIAPQQESVSYTMLPQEAFDIAGIPSEEHWQAMAAANNSDLKKARTAVEMNVRQEKMARSALLPKVALVAEDHLDGPILTEVPPIDKNLNYWFVGVGVSYDLSSLYKGKRKLRSASAAVTHAKQRSMVAAEGVSDAVHAAYVQLRTSQAELCTRQKSMELARQNYDVVANRYQEGLAMVTDMTDAANVRLDAERQYADARIAVAAALYRLKYVAGDI